MDPVRSWWDWCSESFGHMFLGVTAPILLIAALAVLITAGNGGSSFPQPPRSDVAGVCLDTGDSTPPPACQTPGPNAPANGLIIDTATPATPTPTPAPRTYTVQPGDTLFVICASEAPDLPLDTCVAEVVNLSDLGGPDEIVAGQTLLLPGSVPSPANSARLRTPTPAPAQQAIVESGPATPDENDDAESVTATEAAPDPEPSPTDGAGSNPESTPVPEAGQEAEAPAPASLVPILSPLDVSPEATLPPDFDVSDAWLYVVQPGESILRICFEQVPDLPADECALLVVLLNDLGGPDEIYAHQGLLLP